MLVGDEMTMARFSFAFLKVASIEPSARDVYRLNSRVTTERLMTPEYALRKVLRENSRSA